MDGRCKVKIAIDLDGVIWDMLTPWLQWYNRISGDNVSPPDIKSYEISRYIKGEHKELLNYILEMHEFWDEVKPYDGAIEALKKINAHPAVDMVIVTATSSKIAHSKFNRLFSIADFIAEDQIICTSRKDLIAADFVIDDYEHNLRHTVANSNQVGILINQFYNEAFPSSEYRIIRCDSLVDAAEIILEHLNKGE